MAKAFVVDTAKAQQVGDRLAGIAKAIEALPPGPQARGRLGSGVIERAVADFEQAFTAARQQLVRSVDESARRFTGLAKGATSLDQQKGQEVEAL